MLFFASQIKGSKTARVGGRAVECVGLENRYRCKPIGGSNPPLPAISLQSLTCHTKFFHAKLRSHEGFFTQSRGGTEFFIAKDGIIYTNTIPEPSSPTREAKPTDVRGSGF